MPADPKGPATSLLGDGLAGLRAEQFGPFGDDGIGIGALDGVRIGAVHPGKRPVGTAQPNRHVGLVHQPLQGFQRFDDAGVIGDQPRMIRPFARQRHEAYDRAAAAGPAGHLDRIARRRLHQIVERQRMVSQPCNGLFDARRRARLEPSPKGKKLGSRFRRARAGTERADDGGGLVRLVAPDDRTLTLRRGQRLELAQPPGQRGDLSAQRKVLRGRAPALADQPQRRADCRGHGAGEQRQLHDLERVQRDHREQRRKRSVAGAGLRCGDTGPKAGQRAAAEKRRKACQPNKRI
jgi:hypothetical protein